MSRIAKKILLIAWSSADWTVINPLLNDDLLPNLKKFLLRASKGKLSSPDPGVCSTLWSSIITGKLAKDHGILRFTNKNENTIYPIGAADLKVRTLWSLLSSSNIKTHQIGWPGTHPAKIDINGISVSEYFPVSKNETVFPAEEQAVFDELRVTKDQITTAQIKTLCEDYNPALHDVQFEAKIDLLKEFLAHTASTQNAAKKILTDKEWEFLSVCFNDLKWLTFEFGEYYLDTQTLEKGSEHALFKNVLSNAFKLFDTYFGELINLIEFKHHVILLSEAGLIDNANWLNEVKKLGPQNEYKSQGILAIKGRQYSSRMNLLQATALDILPTVTLLFGLPFSKEFVESKALLSLNQIDSKPEVIETWGPVLFNVKPLDENIDEKILQHHLAVLKRVGLIQGEINLDQIQKFNTYYQARYENATGDNQKAIELLEPLYKENKDNSWFGGRLGSYYLAENNLDKGVQVLDEILALGEEIPELHLIKAHYFVLHKKYRSASVELEIAGKNKFELPSIYLQIAGFYEVMHEISLAEKYILKEIEISGTPENHFAIASLYMKNNKVPKAIDHFKSVLKFNDNHPVVLYQLGLGLYKLKKYEEASKYLEEAKKYNREPKALQEIQSKLVDIYANQINRPEKIQEMRENFEKSIGSRGSMVVVSGLPRSGTSMLMQMLHKGGMEIFTDGKREADDNNKKGYYEHEAVKGLAKKKRFLAQVGNKAVKIISHLLHHLPHVYNYKIVFMDRDIEEVMNSQHKMLGRLGKERGENKENSTKLLEPFRKSRENAIKWCKSQNKNVEILLVPYKEAINNPLEQAKVINEFLGGGLDELKMASVVDASLYREKVS